MLNADIPIGGGRMNLSLAFAKFLVVMVTIWFLTLGVMSLEPRYCFFDFGLEGLNCTLWLGAIVGAWAMVLINLLGLNYKRTLPCTLAFILLGSFLSAIALVNFYLYVPQDFHVPVPCADVLATTYGCLVSIYLSREKPAKSSE